MTCQFNRSCVALPAPGDRYCPAHHPRAILERCRAIVLNHGGSVTYIDQILREFDQTV